MAKLVLEEGTLHVTEGITSAPKVSLPLDALRIVALFMPGRYSSPFAERAADRNYINLDELSTEELAELTGRLSSRRMGISRFMLFMEDYSGHYASVSLKDMRDGEVDLFAELANHRKDREEKLGHWTRNVPGLIVTGVDGEMATFDLQGIRASTEEFIPWQNLDRLEVRLLKRQDLSAYHFYARRGSGSRKFVVRIPNTKTQLFLAEYTFWRSLARQRAQKLAGEGSPEGEEIERAS
jgi:hypothetical protein